VKVSWLFVSLDCYYTRVHVFSSSLTHFHIDKRVLRHLKGIINFSIWYCNGNGNLESYVDSNWNGSVDLK